MSFGPAVLIDLTDNHVPEQQTDLGSTAGVRENDHRDGEQEGSPEEQQDSRLLITRIMDMRDTAREYGCAPITRALPSLSVTHTLLGT